MNGDSWGSLHREIVKQYRTQGWAFIPLHQPTGRDLVMAYLPDAPVLEVPRKELGRNPVGKFLWENRHRRAFQRKSAAVWAVYTDGKAQVGVGAIVNRATALRMRTDFWELPHAEEETLSPRQVPV